MIVYCNGDSFVAGTELGDHLLPGHPGYLPFDAAPQLRAKNNEWITNTYDSSHPLNVFRKSLRHQIEIEEKARAWPSKLHELLKCDTINAAVGGASMDRIARTTITDLISLKKDHDNIVAVIGTTGSDRYEVPYMVDSPWADIIPHYSVHQGTEDIVNYNIRHKTDYHSCVNFYKNIILIKDFCTSNNIQLVWLATMHSVELPVEKEYKHAIDFLNLKEYANLNYDIDMNRIAADCGLPHVHAPSYHFTEEIHDLVAKQLLTIIKK